MGFSALYNVSVRVISDIHGEPQVYYLGFTAPTDVITLCFLQSAKHYYASREFTSTITEEHALLSAPIQDMTEAVQSEVSEKRCTFPITINILAHQMNIDISEPNILIEPDNTATKDAMEPKQQDETTTNCVQSIPIPQDQHPVFSPSFQIGASEHKGSKRSSNSYRRGYFAETSNNQQRIIFQPLMIADQTVNVTTSVDTKRAPIALTSDEALSDTQMTPQVGTRTLSKRSIVQTVYQSWRNSESTHTTN